jgi:hypothetical protein
MYYTLILATSASAIPTVTLHAGEDEAVHYAESVVSAGEYRVDWYTVLCSVTGEQVFNGSLNETNIL